MKYVIKVSVHTLKNNYCSMSKGSDKMLDFVLLMMESSGFNVPAPESYLAEQSKELLPNPEVQSVWLDLQIAMSKASPRDSINLIRMMILKYIPLLDSVGNFRKFITEDNHKLLEFIRENEKYRLSSDEVMPESLMHDRMRKLFDDEE